MTATFPIGSAVATPFTAHHEWATRPADERYHSVDALHAAALERQRRSYEQRRPTDLLTVIDVGDRVALQVHDREPAALTHWSFQQLASFVGAPHTYLRTLPVAVTRDALNHGLTGGGTDRALFLTEGDDARAVVQGITSGRYVRVHHATLLDRVHELMASHPSWRLPLGYASGTVGAPLVPNGAYLGDRDLFLFLVDESRAIDDPTDRSGQGLFRGVILESMQVVGWLRPTPLDGVHQPT